MCTWDWKYLLLHLAIFQFPVKSLDELYFEKYDVSLIFMHNNYVISSRYVPSLTSCSLNCLQYNNCMSFFYSHLSDECQLHQIPYSNAIPSVMFTGGGYQYYEAKEAKCPTESGYFYHDVTKLCIKLYVSNSTYYEALNKCQADRARLVKIDCSDKWDFIQSVISKTQIMDYIFIQGTANTTGEVLNDDHTSNSYIESFMITVQEYCSNGHLAVYSIVQLFSLSCTTKYPGFICEKNIKENETFICADNNVTKD